MGSKVSNLLQKFGFLSDLRTPLHSAELVQRLMSRGNLRDVLPRSGVVVNVGH